MASRCPPAPDGADPLLRLTGTRLRREFSSDERRLRALNNDGLDAHPPSTSQLCSVQRRWHDFVPPYPPRGAVPNPCCGLLLITAWHAPRAAPSSTAQHRGPPL
jgi:hypothetical protein